VKGKIEVYVLKTFVLTWFNLSSPFGANTKPKKRFFGRISSLLKYLAAKNILGYLKWFSPCKKLHIWVFQQTVIGELIIALVGINGLVSVLQPFAPRPERH
jgi:hypothetical protein